VYISLGKISASELPKEETKKQKKGGREEREEKIGIGRGKSVKKNQN